MNKVELLGASALTPTSMTPSERAQGRFLRNPEGEHQGGAATTGTPPPAENNTQGNSGDSSGTGKDGENNAGQDKALEGFWSEPKVEEPKPGESNAGEEQTAYAKAMATRLDGLKFEAVFTDEIADQIANGDLKGANQRFEGVARESIRQSVIMSAELMQHFGRNLMAQVKDMIGGAQTAEKNDQTLIEAFPGAKDPAARPLIQQVFNQALKHSGGDRDKAVILARDMLKLVGKSAQKDFGIETPPPGREDIYNADGAQSLVDELLSR